MCRFDQLKGLLLIIELRKCDIVPYIHESVPGDIQRRVQDTRPNETLVKSNKQIKLTVYLPLFKA